MEVIIPESQRFFARTSNREPIEHGLFEARITHTRFAPKPYALAHRLTYLTVALSDLPRLPRAFFSRNRFGLFSLHDRDYGERGGDMESWISSAFRTAGLQKPAGRIVLVTLPRVFGFVFNPVSFWLCHDQAGALSAVLAEVNNTFGERHCYLCRMPDGGPITSDTEIEAEKVFHVSPFLPADGQYKFRFVQNGDRLSIKIDLYREERRILSATIAGRRTTLTSGALLKSFLRHPFPTIQVIMLIHYHAARLYLRGLKYISKPEPPRALVTTSHILTPSRTPPERI